MVLTLVGRGWWLLVVIVMLCVALPEMASAAYRYKNAQGNVSFTDDWRIIPPEFRASAEPPIPAEGLAPAAPSTVSVPSASIISLPAEPSVAPASAAARAPRNLPAMVTGLWDNFWVRLGAFLVAVIAAVFLVLKLVEYIPSPLVGRLVLLACFLGVFVVGYKLYVDNMLANYTTIKQQFIGLMEKANKREDVQLAEPSSMFNAPPEQQ